MKAILTILLLGFSSMAAFGQPKAKRQLVERTYLLSHTVFGTKDSLALEDLFARKATYGHSHGNLQTREEAIAGISRNRSVYTDTAVSKITITMGDDVAIVRYLFRANEVKPDKSVTPLNFSMMLVWVKEKRKWRLMGRQAVSLDK